MSIFPKKITKDESTIIHVRIKNFDNNIKFLQLRTYIEDPNKKIVKKFNRDFLLNLNSSDGLYKDFYFEFKPSKKNICGKYYAKTNLYYKGEVLHSLTSKNDYFYIESLKVKNVILNNSSISFKVFNESKELTNFNIILVKSKDKKIINKKILGLGEKKYTYSKKSFDEIYIEYGNLFCERILVSKKDSVYIRNYKYNWICEGDKLVLYNKNKTTTLSNREGYIWLCCDGIRTISEIAKECHEKKIQTKKTIIKLQFRKLISLKRKKKLKL